MDLINFFVKWTMQRKPYMRQCGSAKLNHLLKSLESFFFCCYERRILLIYNQNEYLIKIQIK